MGKQTRRKPGAAPSRRMSRIVQVGAVIAFGTVLLVGVAVFAGRSQEEPRSTERVSTTEPRGADSALPIVEVYTTPTCGCCSKWVDHLRDAGFEVRTTEMQDLADLKASHGVPRHLESCHTALVAGYVLEGHVPATDIQRLLLERPAVRGLAVPGMPIGSPGMELPGRKAEPYDVVAFDDHGHTEVFATHGG